MRHRRWPRTAHPACQASRCVLTGQKASIAGNGSGRRLVCCSPPRYGMHTPADGTAQPKISQLPAPSAGGFSSPPALPEPGIPGSNPGPQAGEPQRHGHGSSAAGSQGPITPSEQPASSTSQVRLIPLAAPPAVTHPLIFHAKYQNQRWFPTGSAANPWHAGSRTVSLHRQPRLLQVGQNEQRGIGKQSVRHLPSGDDVFRPEAAERQRDQDQRIGDRHRGAFDHPAP
jgi:hypothetical protein